MDSSTERGNTCKLHGHSLGGKDEEGPFISEISGLDGLGSSPGVGAQIRTDGVPFLLFATVNPVPLSAEDNLWGPVSKGYGFGWDIFGLRPRLLD
jgi:hypothetical protein